MSRQAEIDACMFALDHPEVGDYWHERFQPVLVILRVDVLKQEVIICRFKAQFEKGCTWDFAAWKCWSFQKLKNYLRYKKIPGCWAQPVKKGMTVFVEAFEWWCWGGEFDV